MPKTTPPAAGELAGIDTWIFDLDNTLYPAHSRLFDQIDRRIGEFVQRQFGIGHDAAKQLQKSYFQRHGTTLRGLMMEHGIAPGGFLEYVHDIDFSSLEPAERIDRALHRLEGRKIIFTNADVPYAERVMARLGVRHHFEEIYDIAAAGYVPKPFPQAYATLIERYGVVPARSTFFEDIVRNLAPAYELGMTTVWVRHDDDWSAWGADEVDCHYATEDLAGWLEALADGHGRPRPAD